MTQKVKFGQWFEESWSLLTKEWVTWSLISLTVILPILTINLLLIGMGVAGQVDLFKADPLKFMLQNLGQSMSFNLMSLFAVTAVESFFAAGLLHTAFKQMSGQPIALGDLFTGYDQFVNVVVALCIMNLLEFFGYQACIIPGLLVQGLLFLTLPLIVRKGMAPLEALGASFNATRGDWFMFTAFAFVVQLVTGLGILIFCVGFIFLFPLVYLTMAVAYRDFFEPEVKPLSAVDALYTKYCKECGNALPHNATFCDKCGASQV